MLSLKLSDLREDGIHVTPRKPAHSTGKRIIISWSDELLAAVDEAKKLQKKVFSIWLFHTRQGHPYINKDGYAAGFSSIWQKFMARVLSQTKVTERFTEHDLRAKVASDTNGEHARLLLGHASSEITEKVYRRKPEIILPAK